MRTWVRIWAVFLIIALGHFKGGATAAQPTAWSAPIEAFAARLAADVAEDDVGGVSAGVFAGREVVWARGFGWADRDRRIPADSGTIYRTGSISKSFTALVTVLLAAGGTLDLDAAVVDGFGPLARLAGRPEQVSAITYRRLASHTAGLIREPGIDGAATGPIERWEEQVLASIPTTGFLAEPGERYSYSNIGVGILGVAVSRVAGAPFMDLVRRHIIDPLEMDHTFFIIPEGLSSRVAVGYQVGRDRTIDAEQPAREHAGRGYKVPNGGVYSTVHDLARFAAAMMGSVELPGLAPSWRTEIMRVQTPEDPESGYGLGFSIRRRPGGGRAVGHGGSVSGYNAYLVFDPDVRVGVVLLRNYTRGRTNLGAAATELLDQLIAAPVPQ